MTHTATGLTGVGVDEYGGSFYRGAFDEFGLGSTKQKTHHFSIFPRRTGVRCAGHFLEGLGCETFQSFPKFGPRPQKFKNRQKKFFCIALTRPIDPEPNTCIIIMVGQPLGSS